jgi:hypothetical protein
MLGHLLWLRRAAEDSLEGFTCAGQLARLSAHRAGDVILPAQLVQNRAADSRSGERAEGESARRIETRERAHQSHCAGAHHLVDVSFRRECTRQLPRDMVDQTEMLGEEAVTCLLAAAREFLPKLHIHFCHRTPLRSP